MDNTASVFERFLSLLARLFTPFKYYREKLEAAASTVDTLNDQLLNSEIQFRIVAELLEREREVHDSKLQEMNTLIRSLEQTKQEYQCVLGCIPDITAGNFDKVYDSICGVLDPDGFVRYSIAKKLTKINVCSHFSTEDNMGRFENSDGNELLWWLEVAAYGSCDWEPLCSCYELAVNMTINDDTEEYRAYRKAINEQAAKSLLGLPV